MPHFSFVSTNAALVRKIDKSYVNQNTVLFNAKLSSREVEIESGDENLRRGISFFEPFANLGFLQG